MSAKTFNSNKIEQMPEGPVFVHSDALNTLRLVPRNRDISSLAESHIFRIQELIGGRSIWMPTFNYQFSSTRKYEIEIDKSEVGLISETFRKQADWRTNTPIFNVAGNHEKPNIDEDFSKVIEPFGDNSIFSALKKQNGSILWYGAPIAAATILHFVESSGGGPLYRYDKNFFGEIVSFSEKTQVKVRFHVRPKDRYLEYDWPKIESHAFAEQIIKRITLDQPADLFIADVNRLIEFWNFQINSDPFYFLDKNSRDWTKKLIDKLGRRFQIEDFEDENYG